MTLTPVDSTNLSAVGYDVETQTLRVEFRPRNGSATGARWCYEPVSLATFERLMAASSIGSAFHALVKSDHTIHATREDVPR